MQSDRVDSPGGATGRLDGSETREVRSALHRAHGARRQQCAASGVSAGLRISWRERRNAPRLATQLERAQAANSRTLGPLWTSPDRWGYSRDRRAARRRGHSSTMTSKSNRTRPHRDVVPGFALRACAWPPRCPFPEGIPLERDDLVEEACRLSSTSSSSRARPRQVTRTRSIHRRRSHRCAR